MGREEQRMHQHIVHENNVSVVEDIVWDVLDEVWAAIRRLRLSKKKMHRAKLPSPAKEPVTNTIDAAPVAALSSATEVPTPVEKKYSEGTPQKSKQTSSAAKLREYEETVDVTPIAEYLSQQFTRSHHHKPNLRYVVLSSFLFAAVYVAYGFVSSTINSRQGDENATGGPPLFNARDEFQFTGDDLLQSIIASSSARLTSDDAFKDSVSVQEKQWVDPAPTLANKRNNLDHDAAYMTESLPGQVAGRQRPQRPERPYIDPSHDHAEADEQRWSAPSPTWSSNGSQGSCRSRSRVIQRPNVDYDGQNAVSSAFIETESRAPIGALPLSDHSHTSSQQQMFPARPVRPAPSEHFPSHDHRRPQVALNEYAVQNTTNLDAAIEQASFMNMQNILGRRIGRQSANRSTSEQAYPPDWNTQTAFTGASQASNVNPGAFDYHGESVQSGSVGGASAVTEETDPLCKYLDTINLDSTAPMRRSTVTARPQSRQPANKKQHENKNWFSYDEGTPKPQGNNDAWFTFLKQKREQQELNDRSNNGQKASRSAQPEKQERKQRPKSSSGVRSSTPRHENVVHGGAPVPQYATLDGPVYELHHHGAVSAISNGPSSRPATASERSRPISASARLHHAATHSTHQPTSPQARGQAGFTDPSPNLKWDYSRGPGNAVQAEPDRAPFRDETRAEKQKGQQQRVQHREGTAKRKATRGGNPRNKDELIEMLTAAYIGSSK